MRAIVLCGSKNVFILKPEAGETGVFNQQEFQCRLKGKVLQGIGKYYNPIAPGDVVEVQEGLITGIVNRKNSFARFNQKGQAPQLLAANVDMVICVTTLESPSFRPRFIDRVLFQAEYSGIPAVLVCNKIDLDSKEKDAEKRLEDFEHIGYPVLRVSAKTGKGIAELVSLINGKTLVLSGQSGVGKSSLINALNPDFNLKTGNLNKKYKRGNHTTTQPVLYELSLLNDKSVSTLIIDTPGIRRFAPERVALEDITLYMREFAEYTGKCNFGLSCTHEVEPGCKILEAVKTQAIHEDRYESYLRIRYEMAGVDKFPDYD